MSVLYVGIFTIVCLLKFFPDQVSGLSCTQCKNFDTFLTSPQLNTMECSNSSNSIQVDCGVVKFCIKLEGAIYGSSSALPQPNTLDGIQRGCATQEMLKIFTPSGASYNSDGNCQKGDRKIETPYRQRFNSSLAPTYTFSGKYCLCSGDKCNTAIRKTIGFLLPTMLLILISSNC